MYQTWKIRRVRTESRLLAFSTWKLYVTLTKLIFVTWQKRNFNSPHITFGFCQLILLLYSWCLEHVAQTAITCMSTWTHCLQLLSNQVPQLDQKVDSSPSSCHLILVMKRKKNDSGSLNQMNYPKAKILSPPQTENPSHLPGNTCSHFKRGLPASVYHQLSCASGVLLPTSHTARK